MGELASEIKEELINQEEQKTAHASIKLQNAVLLQEESNIFVLKEKDLLNFTNFLPK